MMTAIAHPDPPRKMYMVYFEDVLNQHSGIHVLVAVNPADWSDPKTRAINIAHEKARAICTAPAFFKLEELSQTEDILWVNEWFA